MHTTSQAKSNNLNLRSDVNGDAESLGRICFEAFSAISERHSFPPDFQSPEAAVGLLSMLLSRADVYSVVAEDGGRVVGSNFLWEGDAVAGVGPITVDPSTQNSATGRALMNDVLRHADEKEILSVPCLSCQPAPCRAGAAPVRLHEERMLLLVLPFLISPLVFLCVSKALGS